jgi:hypothetical protein
MLHRAPPATASDLFLLQQSRTRNHIRASLLYTNLWKRFFAPQHLANNRSNWDNLSSSPANVRWNILLHPDDPNKGHAAGRRGVGRDVCDQL